jgi:hypothetical protein
MGTAAPRAALIKYDDSIEFGVEKLPRARVGTRPWSAMNKHRGDAVRVSGFFVINFMQVRDT